MVEGLGDGERLEVFVLSLGADTGEEVVAGLDLATGIYISWHWDIHKLAMECVNS